MMTLTGQFETSVAATALLALHGGPEALAALPTLRDVRLDDTGAVRAVFTPRATAVPMPFTLRVAVQHASAAGAVLTVHATRGPTAVDVELRLEFETGAAGTIVSWSADVAVGGTGATIGQRVVGDVVYAVIDEVLRDTAAVA